MITCLFPKETFDFGSLAASQSQEEILIRALNVEEYGDAVLCIRVHSIDFDSGVSLAFKLTTNAPTCEEPDVDFLATAPAATATIDDSLAAGDLVCVGLDPDFGGYLQLSVVATQSLSAGNLSAELSADLVLRKSVPPKPQTEGDFTVAGTLSAENVSVTEQVLIDGAVAGDGNPAFNQIVIGGSSSADRGMTIRTNSTGNAYYAMTDIDGNLRGGMRWIASNEKLHFYSDGAIHMSLDALNDEFYPFSNKLLDLGSSSNRWDVAYVDTLNVDANIEGKYEAFVSGGYNYTGTALRYVPLAGSTVESSAIAYTTTLIAPYDGTLTAVRFYASGTPGSTAIGIHKNGSGGSTESDTQSISSPGVTTTFTYSTNTISKGDRIHISVNPTAAANNVNFTAVFRWDTRT